MTNRRNSAETEETERSAEWKKTERKREGGKGEKEQRESDKMIMDFGDDYPHTVPIRERA